MNTTLSIILATSTITSIAFLSAGLLSLFPQWLKKITPGLIALAGGTMLSTSFLHLLPESLELLPARTALGLALSSFVSFLLLERIFRWHHCHNHNTHEHHDHRSVGYLNLIGDSFHNFIDGLVIATAFTVNPVLGFTTTLAISAHELPQEIGDFGILIHAGFSRKLALLANFAVASMVIVGGIFGIFLLQYVETLTAYLLPIAAGSFLYIATVDLIPEIHRRLQGWETFGLIFMFVLGLLITPTSELVLQNWGIVEEHSHHAQDEELHRGDMHEEEEHLHEDEYSSQQ